ncbi:ribosomal biogenesis protein LAS1L isoform X1 [Pantherophis guttatus]|uniref:Ribosomal biogenesis protein LAS1L isoform X1 n=1 Tax=Pantherophis guttatus TaxID=94885 RepID=A0A6P9D4N4_PANGU|nr:ribosomal biogenesis protein LAS1L isoform X1 [Pantherophis guttatus]XP_034290962.1 ribosomal biogenesis protein LAS1L isoform X1 [Pantherophis guttatus]XP_034290963.1 ribosomal biogenesis protein LAS1L isoform X1 [Pantherophis guttatus]
MASKPRNQKPRWKLAAKASQLNRPRNVVPWQSKAEWDQVMVGLYCEDCQTQRDALDRVSVWKSRFGSKMPLAVECTADLIRCKLLDAAGILKSHELILTYGLALVRFVNLITERKQKMVTVPLRHLAKELNIPIWIVDLRHDLTHGTLPQLVTCRKGCDTVLDWLRRSYWSCQLGNNLVEEGEEETEESSEADGEDEMVSSQEDPEKTPNEQKHQELCGKVRDVLTSFKNQQLEVLRQQPDVNQACKIWSIATSEVEWVVAQMKDLLQENREVVAETLLEDGFLIPTADTVQILNIPQETHKWDFKMPRAFLRFWQPLLRGLHSRHFTQTLLEKMFDDLKAHARIASLRSQYLINWITKILKANLRVKKKLKSSKAKKKQSCLRLFHHHISLQWLKLLRDCLDAPCWASPHLLHLILLSMEPPLPAEAQEKLLYLTSIYTQEDGAFPTSGSTLDVCKQPMYTVESLLKLSAAAASHKFLKRAGWTEVLPGMVKEKGLAEEEEEEEEEEMDTQSLSQQEPLFLDDPAALAEKRKALQGGVWQVGSDELKWRNFPLGKLPGQTDDPDTLLVDNYTMMSALDQLENGDRKNTPNTVSSEWSGFLTAGLLWTQSELHKLKSGIQLF